ncbi:MAG: hypothetical protein WCF86_00965, partial [Pseudolabrys sp.]
LRRPTSAVHEVVALGIVMGTSVGIAARGCLKTLPNLASFCQNSHIEDYIPKDRIALCAHGMYRPWINPCAAAYSQWP